MTRSLTMGLPRVAQRPGSADERGAAEPSRPLPVAGGYFEMSARPLTTLAFLLPLIVFYEMGTRWYASDPVSHVQQRIIAFSLMQQFFVAIGAAGKYLQYLPAGAIAAILLACHFARNDGWTIRLSHIGGMFVESALYAIPLRALAMAFSHYLPLQATSGQSTRALLVLSVGAGVYEEMMFRFVAFTALSFLLSDLLRMRKTPATVLMVLISAVGFSAYHYLGSEPFEWRSFTFRTVAGIYFGLIFLWRGLGVTAGAHAAYDISTFAIALAAWR
jgi:hypothetical protein